MRSLPVVLGLALSACGGTPQRVPGLPDLTGPLACDGQVAKVTERLGVHFPQGTPLDWESNPPATGGHYENWAPWARAYDRPVPRGNYVHNQEHGGVVLLYQPAASDAPQTAAALAAIGRSLAQDAACAPPINARWIATPDPLLPAGVVVAAAAWGYTYTATCVDEKTLRAFIMDRYAASPEDTCAEGVMAWQ